jgi:hypothetical protein
MIVQLMRDIRLAREEFPHGGPSSCAKEIPGDADAHRAAVIHAQLVESAVVLLFENWWVYLPSIETWTSLF